MGTGKVSNTGNELANLKELQKQSYKFKRNTKAVRRRFKNNNDKGLDNRKPEDASDKFGGKQYKKKSKKNLLLGLHYYVPKSFISYTMKIIVKWLNILDSVVERPSNYQCINCIQSNATSF